MTKPQVRAIAGEHGLITHDKKDSTGICFIGERKFADFLKQYLPAQPGAIETETGRVIGLHQGLMYHTIGQRQGLGIGGLRDFDESPWFVAGKDLARNVLIVVQGQSHPLLYKQNLFASQVEWVNDPPTIPLHCQAKIRYRQPDQDCQVETAEGGLSVRFGQPQRAVTPGQSIVFYEGERCLGGGIIESAQE
jgi:tRNA-specific 2-thiouridylase